MLRMMAWMRMLEKTNGRCYRLCTPVILHVHNMYYILEYSSMEHSIIHFWRKYRELITVEQVSYSWVSDLTSCALSVSSTQNKHKRTIWSPQTAFLHIGQLILHLFRAFIWQSSTLHLFFLDTLFFPASTNSGWR